MTKSSYTNRKFKKDKVTPRKRHQKCDYTTITELLSTVGLSTYSHQSDVVIPETAALSKLQLFYKKN